MATSNAAVVKPNLTECAVCHDTFTVPKILPCGHVICRDCLVTWIQSRPQAACPLCRCVILEPTKQGGRSVEEVADDLPTDLAMTAMVEAETLLSKQHMCCVCDDVAAVALCFQCGDMFCQQCCKMHKKQSATKHHELEELSTLTKERLAAHHPATCPDHNEEISKVHCPTHGTSVCLLCATTKHRNCPEMVNLQSQVGELTAELAQLSYKLTEGAAKADIWLCLLDKHVAELQRESQTALDEMKNVCDRLKAAIEARFVHVSDMTLKLVSDFKAKATDLKHLIIQKRSKIAAHSILADLYKAFTEHKYFKDMVSVVKGRLPDLETVHTLPENLQLNQKLILTIDLHDVADAERIISGLGAVTMATAHVLQKTHGAAQIAPGSTDPAVDQRPSTTRSQGVLRASGGQQDLGHLPDLEAVDNVPEGLQLNKKLLGAVTMTPVTMTPVTMTPAAALQETHRAAQSAPDSTDPAVDQPPSTTLSQSVLSASGGQHDLGQFNPMTVTPVLDFVIKTRTEEDICSPNITSIVTGPSCEVLYMADYNNMSIKVFSLKSNSLISSLKLDEAPRAMVLASDDILAVTSNNGNIIQVDISEIGKLFLHITISTELNCEGISVFETDNDVVKLIVSGPVTERNMYGTLKQTGKVTIHMINVAGTSVRTIVTSQTVPDLRQPTYLHTDTRRDVLYVSGWEAGCVFCVQLSTGRVLQQLEHPELSQPRQVCTDREGNLYVADGGGCRVLVRSVSGAWRELLSEKELGKGSSLLAVCVKDTSIVVSYSDVFGLTKVKIYKMT